MLANALRRQAHELRQHFLGGDAPAVGAALAGLAGGALGARGSRGAGRPLCAAFAGRLPWASVHLEVDQRHVLREGGFHEFPCAIPRWSRIPGSV